MITVNSDIRLSFENLIVHFQRILDQHETELKQIVEKAIEDYDFNKVLNNHVHSKINESLEEAFQEIDLSDTLKRKIWVKIEEELKEN